jgi:hypothetical protein
MKILGRATALPSPQRAPPLADSQKFSYFLLHLTYCFLQNRMAMDDIDINVKVVLKRVWLNVVLSKVSIFG